MTQLQQRVVDLAKAMQIRVDFVPDDDTIFFSGGVVNVVNALMENDDGRHPQA